MSKDYSNGYEGVADEFIAVRSNSGETLIKEWAASLPCGGSVLDVGAGSGEPITSVLIDAGLTVAAIDASPTMVAAFRKRFCDIEIVCEAAEKSALFNRTFDGMLAVGLIFLLPADDQVDLITRLGRAVKPGGRLLFSAPQQICPWEDMLTGYVSRSLGAKEYSRLLEERGFHQIANLVDDAGSFYYDARKI